MIQTEALVTDVGEGGPFVRVVLSSPELAGRLSPGRFVLADLGGDLRTALFPARLEDQAFAVWVSPDHPAAALEPDERLDLMGPLGRGFEVKGDVRRLLLVSDTARLPVLLPLALQAIGPAEEPRDPRISVALLLSAPTAAGLYPIRLLPPALEVHIVTTDGSAGRRGSILDLSPDLVRWADSICVAHDPRNYLSLARIVQDVRMNPRERFAQALVVPTMVCGVGACQGCAVETTRGFKLACAHGPVFDLLELRCGAGTESRP